MRRRTKIVTATRGVAPSSYPPFSSTEPKSPWASIRPAWRPVLARRRTLATTATSGPAAGEITRSTAWTGSRREPIALGRESVSRRRPSGKRRPEASTVEGTLGATRDLPQPAPTSPAPMMDSAPRRPWGGSSPARRPSARWICWEMSRNGSMVWYERERSRPVRGGSWLTPSRDARLSGRSGVRPSIRRSNLGLRCAFSPRA